MKSQRSYQWKDSDALCVSFRLWSLHSCLTVLFIKRKVYTLLDKIQDEAILNPVGSSNINYTNIY